MLCILSDLCGPSELISRAEWLTQVQAETTMLYTTICDGRLFVRISSLPRQSLQHPLMTTRFFIIKYTAGR